MPTPRYYKYQYTAASASLPNLIRFLANDRAVPIATGPGWTIVEAYSNSTREVPSDPTDFDTLLTASNWVNDSIAQGDWIVLQASGFQVYFEWDVNVSGDQNIGIVMFPKSDFATGGANTSPPTFPSTVLPSTTLLDFRTRFHSTNTGSDLLITCDEETLIMYDDSFRYTASTSNNSFIYIGAITGSYSGYLSPYVISNIITNGGFDAINDFYKLDPILSASTISNIDALVISEYGTSPDWYDQVTDGALGRVGFVPIPLASDTSAFEHWVGWLKYCYIGPQNMSGSTLLSGSVNNRSYWFRNPGTATPVGSTTIIQWDGSTNPFPDP